MIYIAHPAPERLAHVQEILAPVFGPETLRATTDPAQAESWIAQARPELLFASLQLPNRAGLALIARALDRWKRLPLVAETHEALERAVTFGALTCIPRTMEGGTLLGVLRGAIATPPPEEAPFSTSPIAMIRLHAMAGSSGLLTLRTPSERGDVWLLEGRIVRAEAGALQWSQALSVITQWAEAEIHFEADAPSNSSARLRAYEVDALPRRVVSASTTRITTLKRPAPTRPLAPQLPRLRALQGCLAGGFFRASTGETLAEEVPPAQEEAQRAFAQAAQDLARALQNEGGIETLASTRSEFHLQRPLARAPDAVAYAVFHRSQTNLALARLSVAEVAGTLSFPEEHTHHGEPPPSR